VLEQEPGHEGSFVHSRPRDIGAPP
jgi:hypothetical protein